MVSIRYSEEKNQLLIAEHGISFVDVLQIIANRSYLTIIAHPRKAHQRLIIFDWKGYVYYAPFVTGDDGSWFLKTIIPSRKMTKHYHGDMQDGKKQEKTR